MKIKEGFMPFSGHQTYYRIVGECKNGKKPLVLLHGGPGSTHNYFELLDDLALDGRAIISYDQLGCGKSYCEEKPEFFHHDLWIQELIELRKYLGLDEVHLLGQSWGGMMEIIYAIDHQPKGICSLTLSSTLASSKLYASEQHRMIKALPQNEQDAIFKAELNNDFSSIECLNAIDHYMELHCCATPDQNSPDCLKREKVFGEASYINAWGPNEFTPTGTLKDYDYTDRLNEIDIPTLIISGTDDLSTPLVSKALYDGICNSEWKLIQNARHMVFADQKELYETYLLEFLNKHDQKEETYGM